MTGRGESLAFHPKHISHYKHLESQKTKVLWSGMSRKSLHNSLSPMAKPISALANVLKIASPC